MGKGFVSFFLKGDKVRVVKNLGHYSGIEVGVIYEVASVQELGVWVYGKWGRELYLTYSEVELDRHSMSGTETEPKEHNHYFIDVGEFYDSDTGKCEIDVYVILEKFGITNPCLQHIAKKALATGKRGHKNYERDLQDIIDTAEREKVIHSNRK